MSASETGALRAGENGVVSPTQIKRELDCDLRPALAIIARQKTRIAELEEKCDRLERELADRVLKSRGWPAT